MSRQSGADRATIFVSDNGCKLKVGVAWVNPGTPTFSMRGKIIVEHNRKNPLKCTNNERSGRSARSILYRIVPSAAELRYRGVDIRGTGGGNDLVARLERIERRAHTADVRRSAQTEDLFYHGVHVPLP